MVRGDDNKPTGRPAWQRFAPWWVREPGPASSPTHRITRSVFLRGLGLIYLAAFWSLGVQIDGLVGSRGILPVGESLAQARLLFGRSSYWLFPTLLWIDPSDWLLSALCWGGAAVSVLLVVGVLPGPSTVILWMFYLSLTVAGRIFLAYQWDMLLLETGLLAILLAPWSMWLDRDKRQVPRLVIWLLRWLLFRLMFLAGVVKLASGDPTWRAWQALQYHYETQPIPTWTSWYVHQAPPWFQALSVGLMFWCELVAPLLIFSPRPGRWITLVSIAGLQLLIIATGNYGCFNLLAILLCVSLLDDRDFGKKAPGTETREAPGRARRILLGALGSVILLVTSMEFLSTLWPAVPIPSQLQAVVSWVAPLRSMNSYGLFAVMTTERPEITVEGSDDGEHWRPYLFRWKAGELDRSPRFVTPHLPRLDWQMWFAALDGDVRHVPWFLSFTKRLLEGSPEVLGLLRENPFPARPPRYVRARLDRYHFTTWGDRNWWRSEPLGLFCPPLELSDFSPDTSRSNP